MPFMSTMGAFRSGSQNANEIAYDTTYVRTIAITGSQATQWQMVNLTNPADRTSTIDSSGYLYVMSAIFYPGPVTNGLTLNITKFTPTRNVGVVKEYRSEEHTSELQSH